MINEEALYTASSHLTGALPRAVHLRPAALRLACVGVCQAVRPAHRVIHLLTGAVPGRSGGGGGGGGGAGVVCVDDAGSVHIVPLPAPAHAGQHHLWECFSTANC